ncbi:PQQ-binding-like beta-propeller repeat protein [Candidatus Gracilibacteria bacterium]|nr:PQQ-binding-like beta-propeller repeat protein [Candidatus Gracilibacteria bacterium]MCF7856058.1 PQQ-binding-like beta-propeller repeat protein [Candidatus Gracilibacteria bacterium]MCF7896387.1 PQQ-binding-like beta-propeller repeat protein [Candidatus Gracilibacteria bacterium]
MSTKGKQGKWLVDLRRTFMDAEGLELSAKVFWDKFEKKWPFQVGGLEAGSVPLVAAMILEGRHRGLKVNGFFVRKERKNHGRQHLIEGEITNDPIVVVDDLMNAGGTLNKVRVALEDINRKIREVFVIVNYYNVRGQNFLKENNIKIFSIYRLADFGLERGKTKKIPQSKFKQDWHFQPFELGHYFVVPKSTPALDSQNLYFGSDAAIFWAVNQKTGKPAWYFQCGKDLKKKGIFSSPALHRDRVFFGSYDGNVYCLDTKNGSLIWKFGEGDWVGSSPALAPELGLLFIGIEKGVWGKKGSVLALDIQTGEKVWEYVVKELLHGSPAYSKEKGIVAIGTNDATLLLFEAKTGRKIWEFQAGGPIKYRPTFDLKNNAVLAGSHDGKIYSIDLGTGKENWSVQTEDIIYSTPLIVGNKVYVTSSDKRLYVINLKTGKVLKEIRAIGNILSSPREILGKIYFGSNDGAIYEINPKSNEISGKLYFPERITNAVTYSPKQKLFFALANDNRLFAFRKMKS